MFFRNIMIDFNIYMYIVYVWYMSIYIWMLIWEMYLVRVSKEYIIICLEFGL